MVRGTRRYEPSKLLPELLERVFLVYELKERIVYRFVFRAWCFAVSRCTHRALVFDLEVNWQHRVTTSRGREGRPSTG